MRKRRISTNAVSAWPLVTDVDFSADKARKPWNHPIECCLCSAREPIAAIRKILAVNSDGPVLFGGREGQEGVDEEIGWRTVNATIADMLGLCLGTAITVVSVIGHFVVLQNFPCIGDRVGKREIGKSHIIAVIVRIDG